MSKQPRIGSAVVAGTLLMLATAPVAAQDRHLEIARRVLSSVPLFDGHNDLPYTITERAGGDVAAYDIRGTAPGDTDIPRLRDGMIGAQFWSVYVPFEAVAENRAARAQLEQIDIAKQIIDRYPDVFGFAGTASEVEDVWGSGRIASLFGIEGGHVIENSLGALRAFYDLGVRYMTLTHFGTIDWADSATDAPRHDGLTRFGQEVVREMNRLGMLVDLSHVAPSTMSDALDVAEAPVIFSHSAARALADHVRNVPDDILRRLPENGGVVMLVFYPAYISQEAVDWGNRELAETRALRERLGGDEDRVQQEMERWRAANPAPGAGIGAVADHIDHIKRVAGVDHIAMGSDFDGIPAYIDGLDDVSKFPALFAELSRRGYTEDELRKIAGGNMLRVMREAERTAARLQRERPPSTATIEELDGPRRTSN